MERRNNNKRKFENRERRSPIEDSFEHKILRLSKVNTAATYGRRFSFTVLIMVRDSKSGSVGIAYHKGRDVPSTIKGALAKAKERSVVFFEEIETIPFDVFSKFNATKILLKPIRSGLGVRAGGVLNPIIKSLGIKNVSAKIFGSRNKLNVIHCFLKSLNVLTGKTMFF